MPVAIAIIIVLITLANIWHVLSQAIVHPPNHLFTGIAHYFADYFLYVSQIAQSQHSNTLFAEHLFTNEQLSPTWIYWFNTLLGKIQISPFLTYNAALVLLVIGLLSLLWHIIKRAVADPATQYVAFIFTVSASNFFDFTTFFRYGTFKLLGDFWFSPTPALNRLGGVPHQVLQTILILSVIMLCTTLSESPKKSPFRYVLLCVITLLATSANPIQMLLIALTYLTMLAWQLYKKRLKSSDVAVASFVFLPALLGAWMTNFEFSQQPILTAAKTWENNQQFSISIPQFMWAMGPIALCIPLGIYASIKKHTQLFVTLVLYTLLSLLFFFSPIPTMLGTSAVRWLSPAAYVGLALLASLGCMWCITIIGKKINHKKFTMFIAITIYMLLTIPSIISQITARTIPLATDTKLIALNHISYDVVYALTTIQNSPNDGIVLTDPALPYDVVVPAMTGKKSFTGHPIHTLYPDTKERLRQQFFHGQMDAQRAEQFITDHHIVYIITTPSSTSFLHAYPSIKPLFTNNAVAIFKRTP